MEPVNEAPQPITAYCRACGKGLTSEMVRNYNGMVYCAEHVPASQQSSNPYTASAASTVPPSANAGVSPGLAFLLGLIPGVGAIYNGQYAKGFVHVLVTGVLFSLSGRESGHWSEFPRAKI